jgi:methylenetetrahydrofolate--tRNA-(uracil-5-)-methyltransferase
MIVQLRGQQARHALQHCRLQTKLKHGAQRGYSAPFRAENAGFARLGGLHHNTFLSSPKLLDQRLRLRAPRLRFAGQMTGCQGYVESASIGLIAGLYASANSRSQSWRRRQRNRAGSLLGHITGGHIETIDSGPRSFQP